MARIDLSLLSEVDGFIAASLVDIETGMALATIGAGFDFEISAVGNAEVITSTRRIMRSLRIDDEIEDMVISLFGSIHMIRPLERNNQLFLHLVLDRNRANFAIARHKLRTFEKQFEFA